MVRLFQPPVALDWSSAKLKILGVFIGHGNLEEENWHPRIDTMDHVLMSWRSRSLTFCGKALFINALALSRVWYVASLVHVPAWVEKELSRFVFSFFWSGKRELVSRSTVVQPHLFGGFSVVNVKFKVFALLDHLFYYCPLAQSVLSCCNCCCSVSPSCVRLSWCVTFVSALVRMNCASPLVSLSTF